MGPENVVGVALWSTAGNDACEESGRHSQGVRPQPLTQHKVCDECNARHVTGKHLSLVTGGTESFPRAKPLFLDTESLFLQLVGLVQEASSYCKVKYNKDSPKRTLSSHLVVLGQS